MDKKFLKLNTHSLKAQILAGIKGHEIAFLFFINILLTLPGLWVPYYNVDETTNAIFGFFLNQGDMNLTHFLGDTSFFTHYLFAVMTWLFHYDAVTMMHLFHGLWKGMTTVALYYAGKEMHGRGAGIWAAFFYTCCSLCFMSKDFHTPSAESLSLLPAVLSAYFLFCHQNRGALAALFLSGAFVAVATLFKTPIGVILVAGNLFLLMRFKRPFTTLIIYNLGFWFAILLPAAFVMPFGEGFRLMYAKFHETKSVYIQFYDDFSLLYWGMKFLLRSFLVFASSLVMCFFAAYSFKTLFHLERNKFDYWQRIFFLFTWLFLSWLTVAIGKRVFFHYFVFLEAPLALLAGAGIRLFDVCVRIDHTVTKEKFFGFYAFLRRHIFVLCLVPVLGFSLEGALNFSTKPPKLSAISDYIQQNTKPHERIFIWGAVPQLYYQSQRQPASTFIWSDILAGFLPGSPAMEYKQATGKSLNVYKLMAMDFKASAVQEQKTDDGNSRLLYSINDKEFFTTKELLNTIGDRNWKQVFSDFFKRPPELFIDGSPSNYRGFGFHPLYNYELLRHFLLDNYKVETRVGDYVVYRFKRSE